MYLQRSRVGESLEIHLILTSSLSAVLNGCYILLGMAGCFVVEAPVIKMNSKYF